MNVIAISDEALAAAARAFGKATEASDPNLYKQLSAALEAAAPYLIAAQQGAGGYCESL
jgi:hypothetical protein